MNQYYIIGLSVIIGLFTLVGIIYYIYKAKKKKDIFKTQNSKDKEKFNEKYAYRVTVADKFSKTFREVSTFGVEKRRNNENILTLVNDDKKFDEFFPYDNDDEEYNLEFVEEKITQTKNKLKNNTKINHYNLKSELVKWEKIRHNLINKGGEFMKIDKDGVPHILFIRHGSVNVPWKWNSDAMHIQPPSDPFIKDVIASREDKRKKYLEKNLRFREVIVTIGLFIMLAMVVCNGFWSYFNAKFDDTDIKAMQERIDNAPLLCAEYLGTASNNFVKASENSLIASQNAVNITNTAGSWVNKKLEPVIPVENIK